MKLIHAALIHPAKKRPVCLLLRQIDPHLFAWFEENTDGVETQTDVSAPNFDEALRMARKKWQRDSFRTFNCGFRYTLPERDEHGVNALFHQMADSYNSMNGVYQDQDLGHPCIVHNASQEARLLFERLRQAGRL